MTTTGTLAAAPIIIFEVQHDGLLHFGYRPGDSVEIRPVLRWDHLVNKEVCLIRENESGREFLAAVDQEIGHIEHHPIGSSVLLYERFFGGGILWHKHRLTLIGRVNRHVPAGYNLVAQATEVLKLMTAYVSEQEKGK